MDHQELELMATNILEQMNNEIKAWRNTHDFFNMTQEERDVVVAELNGRRDAALRAYELIIDEVFKMRHQSVLSKLNADNKIEPIKLISQ